MDCGDFVKIGVSGNVEQRATQIPYKVNRIFSTDELKNAFKLEHEMHMMFCEDRVPNALGREYFNISFDIAVSELKKRADEQKTMELVNPIPKKPLSISEKQKVHLAGNHIQILPHFSVYFSPLPHRAYIRGQNHQYI
jgi:hypothetical protein